MNFARHPELLDQLAASHALGTLRGGARRRFEAMARQSPALRVQALVWQERLASLTELQPSEVPHENVWKRIALAVEAQRPAPQAAPAGVAPAVALRLQRLQRLLGLWRGAALAAGAVAVVAVLASAHLGGQLDDQTRQLADATQQNNRLVAQLADQPRLAQVAVLADAQAQAALLVTFDAQHQRLTLQRVGDYREADDRSLQLWALPPAGASTGPRSLGVLDGGPVLRLSTSDATLRGVPALAVSLEPKGGVPGDKGPTGPVLFQGAWLATSL